MWHQVSSRLFTVWILQIRYKWKVPLWILIFTPTLIPSNSIKIRKVCPTLALILLCNGVMVQCGSGSLRYTCSHGNTARHLVTTAVCMWATSSGWGSSLVAGASRDESWTVLSSVSTVSRVPSIESGSQSNWKQERRRKHQHTYLEPPPTLLGVSVKYLVSLLSHISTA